MKQTLLAAVLLVAATATSALADDTGKTTTQVADNDCQRARKAGRVCALSFDTPDEVVGSVIKPDGEGLDAVSAISFSSLIRMRWDFRAEIIRAAEDI